MILYNVLVKQGDQAKIFTVETPCNIQFNVPNRTAVIEYMTKNFGQVIRIDEISKSEPKREYIKLNNKDLKK